MDTYSLLKTGDDCRVDSSGWNRCWFSSCDEVSNKSSAGVIPLVTTVEINMAQFVKNSAQKRSLEFIEVLKVLRGELLEVTGGGGDGDGGVWCLFHRSHCPATPEHASR